MGDGQISLVSSPASSKDTFPINRNRIQHRQGFQAQPARLANAVPHDGRRGRLAFSHAIAFLCFAYCPTPIHVGEYENITAAVSPELEIEDSIATLFPQQFTSRKLAFSHALLQGYDYGINNQ